MTNPNREEILCLYSLAETTNRGLLPKDYYFGDYRESHICLNKINNEWQVYCCERGKKFDIETFNDCKKACIKIIWECSYNKEEVEKAIECFLSIFQISSTLSEQHINSLINKYNFNIDSHEKSKRIVKKQN